MRKSFAVNSRSPRKSDQSVPLVFFVDRSLGKHIVAKALRDAGAVVEVHDDHFPQDATDVEWLTASGKKGWIVLSKDKQIRRNPIERKAIANAGVKSFFLTQQGLSGPEMASIFAKALPGMTTRAATRPGPFIYTISRAGVFASVK